jgi:hypothetical protein
MDTITPEEAVVAAEKFAMAVCRSHQAARLPTQSVQEGLAGRHVRAVVLAFLVQQAKTQYLVNFVRLEAVVAEVGAHLLLDMTRVVVVEAHRQHRQHPLLALLGVLVLMVDQARRPGKALVKPI